MTATLLLGTAAGLTTVGCCLFYLSCPQQSWFQQPLTAVPSRLGSIVSVAVSSWLLTQKWSISSALFTQLLLIFLLLGVLPFTSLWLPQRSNAFASRNNGSNGSNGRSSNNNTADQPNNMISTDWWSKSLTGIVLGFSLAVSLSGLLAWSGPDGIDASNKVQLVMWTIGPMWLLIISLVFLFRSGWRAALYLGCANVLSYGALLMYIE